MTSKKDHIAIIGAGFSGLASAYYLSKAGYKITIYDHSPIGENASGISAGLLHCYTGKKAKPAENAHKKLQTSLELLHASSEAMGFEVYKKTGLFRPAICKDQDFFYRQRAEQAPDVTWISGKEITKRCQELSPFSGIWISNGYQIDTKNYLRGLWKASRLLGAEWKSQKVHSTEGLTEDFIIITTGAFPILQTQELAIHPIKGQIIEIEWENNLSFPISANIYFVPSEKPKRCFVGGTFEHRFDNHEPDIENAKALLFPKIVKLFPKTPKINVVGCHAALRASTPDRLPILKKLNGKTWVLVGMGSKGLLNHAFYAKKLLSLMISE